MEFHELQILHRIRETRCSLAITHSRQVSQFLTLKPRVHFFHGRAPFRGTFNKVDDVQPPHRVISYLARCRAHQTRRKAPTWQTAAFAALHAFRENNISFGARASERLRRDRTRGVGGQAASWVRHDKLAASRAGPLYGPAEHA